MICKRLLPQPLLPLLRSRLQAEILTLVLLGPEHEWSPTGLASRTGASVSSVQREITRAEQAGCSMTGPPQVRAELADLGVSVAGYGVVALCHRPSGRGLVLLRPERVGSAGRRITGIW